MKLEMAAEECLLFFHRQNNYLNIFYGWESKD
jgi:hypothetical protein